MVLSYYREKQEARRKMGWRLVDIVSDQQHQPSESSLKMLGDSGGSRTGVTDVKAQEGSVPPISAGQ